MGIAERRARGEAEWRNRFEEYGLNESFEFVGREWGTDHGRKVALKCRKCGTEFSNWSLNDVFKGKQIHLICPECGASSDGSDMWTRSRECDEAMEFYVAGHSVRETANRFNVSTNQINNVVKIRGLTNGRDWRTAASENRRREGEQRIIEKAAERGFEYLGGYDNKTSRVKLRCLKCGHEIERTGDAIKDGKTFCLECKKAETRERRESERRRRKAEQEKKTKEREAERIKKNPLGLSSYQIEKEKKLDEVFTCKVCGKEYTPRQYMESEGLTLFSNVGYCSHECKRKAANKARKSAPSGKTGNYRHRARKYGCKYEPGITLKKLIARDGLRCAICGEMCDPNDHRWTKYGGPLSPTMDHIVPLVKGGGHVWNNVQVAHWICNSAKSDEIEEV